MRKKKLFWQLYPSYLFIALSSLIIIAIVACVSFRSFYFKKTAEDLESRCLLISDQIIQSVQSKNYSQSQKLTRLLGEKSKTRFTVVLPDGRVVSDSQENPQSMDNHRDRAEIYEAIQKNFGTSIRYSHTLKQDMMYFALSVPSPENEIIAVIRASIPLTSIQETLWGIYYKVFFACLILLVAIALVSWWLAKRMSRPIEEMKGQARSIVAGDFSKRIISRPTDSLEMDQLGEAMNEIATRLDERIKTILEQNTEKESIFSSMSEGILALDSEERVKYLNDATTSIFNLSSSDFENKSVQEVIRNPELYEFIKLSLLEKKHRHGELVLKNGSEKCIEIYSSPLRTPNGESNGTVLVFNDITRLRELESHRRDFVANASHELRTPLTSIQGYAELLMNPDNKSKAEANNFLAVIHKHAARLGTIIEDLLSLARIEKDAERTQIELKRSAVSETLTAALELCSVAAKKRKISIDLNYPDNLLANINSPLLEQAVVNLVDNAIKYSKEGATVQVRAQKSGNEVEISVLDFGVGIPAENLPRLFERFYRVDKARSRELGGTGLGLSIVKHVSIAHRGHVEVKSEPGKGSCFSIFLPAS